MKNINLSEYHPIVDLRENIIFVGNGNIVAAFKVELPEIYSLSEKDFEDLHGTWFQALKSLPVGTVVHKQDLYRKQPYTAEELPKTTFLGKATHDYFKGRSYFEHQSYFFFLLPHNRNLNNSKYINPFCKVSEALIRTMDENFVAFKEAVEEAVSFVNNSRKIKLIPLTSKEIKSFTDHYFNGFTTGYDTAMVLHRESHTTPSISIGENYFDVLAVNNELCFEEPVQSSRANPHFTAEDFTFHQGFADGLGLTLSENHIVNQILYLDDQHKWRKLLEKRVEELQKSAQFGSQNKVVQQKIQSILDQINTDENARIIRGHFNIIYWDESPSRLKRIRSTIKTELKELGIVPYYPNGKERKNYILNSFPCFSPNFSDYDLFVTDLKHALCLFINNTHYQSDPAGVIFNSRIQNIPVVKDVWDEEKRRIKARNFVIFAPTGEGKSFLANNILRQYFESGVRLVIIDLGGSYTKFAKLYSDRHVVIRYQTGKSLGINPFYIENKADLTPGRIEDLSVFLFELFAAEMTITKAQSVAVKKILQDYYRNIPHHHSLQSFYQYIEENQQDLLEKLKIHPDYFNVTGFLHVLSEYVEGGLYSYLFETREDQSYKLEDKQLIVFELDEVEDNKEILSMMLKLIKTAIQRTIWQNKSEKGIILFDEFAKQLKFNNVLESVEFYYQAIRKQNGAIGIILQSINQLPENSTSASILDNTQILYSLNNEKGYDALAQRLHLSSHDLNQLKSIKNKLYGERKYTEIFIKIGRESNVFRLEVPPEAYAAYLTDGAENEELLQLYREYQNMEKAIRTFIQKS